MLAAISLFFKFRLGNRYAFGAYQEADIWLFDVDKVDGRSEWETHRTKRSGIPAILVSIREITLENEENVAFAAKPLNTELLTSVLEQVTRSGTTKTRDMPTQREGGTAPVEVEQNSAVVSYEAAELPVESAITFGNEHQSAPKGLAPDHVDALSGANPSMPDSAELAVEPSTFMPDSTWFQDSLVGEDKPAVDARDSRTTEGGLKLRHAPPKVQAAVRKLGVSHHEAFIGSMPDIDTGDPRQLEKARFDPNRFLAGVVSRAAAMAIRAELPVRISGKDWTIVIQPSSNRVFVNSTRTHLRTLATIPLTEQVKTQVLGLSENETTFDGVKWRLSALQWTLMLMAARGRVPFGTDLDVKVRLKQWPNLTRLQTFPNVMRIASLWSRQPVSLVESASVLGIPQRYVFAFYSAVHVLGLVETLDSENAPRGSADNQPVKRHRSLFRKILSHLGLG